MATPEETYRHTIASLENEIQDLERELAEVSNNYHKHKTDYHKERLKSDALEVDLAASEAQLQTSKALCSDMRLQIADLHDEIAAKDALIANALETLDAIEAREMVMSSDIMHLTEAVRSRDEEVEFLRAQCSALFRRLENVHDESLNELKRAFESRVAGPLSPAGKSFGQSMPTPIAIDGFAPSPSAFGAQQALDIQDLKNTLRSATTPTPRRRRGTSVDGADRDVQPLFFNRVDASQQTFLENIPDTHACTCEQSIQCSLVVDKTPMLDANRGADVDVADESGETFKSTVQMLRMQVIDLQHENESLDASMRHYKEQLSSTLAVQEELRAQLKQHQSRLMEWRFRTDNSQDVAVSTFAPVTVSSATSPVSGLASTPVRTVHDSPDGCLVDDKALSTSTSNSVSTPSHVNNNEPGSEISGTATPTIDVSDGSFHVTLPTQNDLAGSASMSSTDAPPPDVFLISPDLHGAAAASHVDSSDATADSSVAALLAHLALLNDDQQQSVMSRLPLMSSFVSQVCAKLDRRLAELASLGSLLVRHFDIPLAVKSSVSTSSDSEPVQDVVDESCYGLAAISVRMSSLKSMNRQIRHALGAVIEKTRADSATLITLCSKVGVSASAHAILALDQLIRQKNDAESHLSLLRDACDSYILQRDSSSSASSVHRAAPISELVDAIHRTSVSLIDRSKRHNVSVQWSASVVSSDVSTLTDVSVPALPMRLGIASVSTQCYMPPVSFSVAPCAHEDIACQTVTTSNALSTAIPQVVGLTSVAFDNCFGILTEIARDLLVVADKADQRSRLSMPANEGSSASGKEASAILSCRDVPSSKPELLQSRLEDLKRIVRRITAADLAERSVGTDAHNDSVVQHPDLTDAEIIAHLMRQFGIKHRRCIVPDLNDLFLRLQRDRRRIRKLYGEIEGAPNLQEAELSKSSNFDMLADRVHVLLKEAERLRQQNRTLSKAGVLCKQLLHLLAVQHTSDIVPSVTRLLSASSVSH